MNHKRKRSRNQRAGCKFCKYWKVNGYTSHIGEEFEKFSDHRRRIFNEEEINNSDLGLILEKEAETNEE